MNLHAVVRGAIRRVNPDIAIELHRSTGYTTNAAGKRENEYLTLSGRGQVQALSGPELAHVNNVNLQDVVRGVYLYGNWQGVVRADAKGGDVLLFPQVPGAQIQSWRVYQVLETWPEWCKVAVVLQKD